MVKKFLISAFLLVALFQGVTAGMDTMGDVGTASCGTPQATMSTAMVGTHWGPEVVGDVLGCFVLPPRTTAMDCNTPTHGTFKFAVKVGGEPYTYIPPKGTVGDVYRTFAVPFGSLMNMKLDQFCIQVDACDVTKAFNGQPFQNIRIKAEAMLPAKKMSNEDDAAHAFDFQIRLVAMTYYAAFTETFTPLMTEKYGLYNTICTGVGCTVGIVIPETKAEEKETVLTHAVFTRANANAPQCVVVENDATLPLITKENFLLSRATCGTNCMTSMTANVPNPPPCPTKQAVCAIENP